MVLKISIFDRFIFKQVLKATLVCLLLFIIVWIAPETLVKIIKKIFNNVWTITEGLKYLIYELPKVLGKALPVGILLGSLFTFDKLSKDSELSILRGIGLSSFSCVCMFLCERQIDSLCLKSNGRRGKF